MFFGIILLKCLAFIISVSLALSRGEDGVSLSTIIQASADAINSSDVQKHMDVVAKYYFTSVKEQSVWYVAQKWATKMFHIDLGKDDMKFLEKLISAVSTHYNECKNMDIGTRRADCFYQLASFAADMEHGFRWTGTSDISFERKAKFGHLYNSAAILIAHLALIAKENFKQFVHKLLIRDKLHEYKKALETTVRLLDDIDISLIAWRLDAIEPPVICDINEHFWKEFVGLCEARWRRSVDTEDEMSAKRVMAGLSNENTGMINQTVVNDKVVTLKAHYHTRENPPMLGVAEKIGRSFGMKEQKYRVQVSDNVKNEVLYEEYGIADYTQRSSIMNEMAKNARIARGKAYKRLERKIVPEIKSIYSISYDILAKTVISKLS